MRAYGHVRCYGKHLTRTCRGNPGSKIEVYVGVKNHKKDRVAAKKLLRQEEEGSDPST